VQPAWLGIVANMVNFSAMYLTGYTPISCAVKTSTSSEERQAFEKGEFGEGLPLTEFRSFAKNNKRFMNFSVKENTLPRSTSQCVCMCMEVQAFKAQQTIKLINII
jgi:hypothetical protein